ncbi:MAG: carboxypeptidase M32 [Myxococcota bacterium]
MTALQELKAELRTIHDLHSAAAVLEWDQSTYMPARGAEARGRQIALLGKLAHERRTSPRMADLLSQLSGLSDDESVDGALYRRAHRLWERATQVPAELVAEAKAHAAETYVAWTQARAENNFAAIRPFLEKNVELSRRWAGCFPDANHVLDPFVDAMDPGMTAASIRTLFSELRDELVPLVEAILEKPAPDRSCLEQFFPKDQQLAFGRQVVTGLGYDFARGRQDLTAHPFMIRFAANDIRITTRVNENDLEPALLGTVHEAGHAMYEQQIDPAFDGTPLGEGTSMGVHESQSRLWENLVARSRPFWLCYFPELRARFPDQFRDVTVDEFYRAINRVGRSLIRVESDEVTYNLHVMLRFELEAQMLEGTLPVADLPDAWNARIQNDLGVTPASDAEGCMQDVHWFASTVGGTFQGYTLGNLMAAQFYQAAEKALPTLSAEISRGNTAPLRQWLAEHVHQHGARYLPDELMVRATGRPLEIAPFLAHLRAKYGDLYGLTP